MKVKGAAHWYIYKKQTFRHNKTALNYRYPISGNELESEKSPAIRDGKVVVEGVLLYEDIERKCYCISIIFNYFCK